MARVAYVPVERLDVVPVGVKKKCCVVAGSVLPIAGRAVGTKACFYASSVKRVDLLA